MVRERGGQELSVVMLADMEHTNISLRKLNIYINLYANMWLRMEFCILDITQKDCTYARACEICKTNPMKVA